MFEKVNPGHPDKVADRIAGAIVDLAYKYDKNPRIAVEVLIGHGMCHVIAESSVHILEDEVEKIVNRIAGRHSKTGKIITDYMIVQQDINLALNQRYRLHCGDNGIFKGMPVTSEQRSLSLIARGLYKSYPYDGKYILDRKMGRMIICQSHADNDELKRIYPNAVINPLGEWTGGTDVDSGATNRKLGSDMGDSITGGGLHGKDLSKADVSVNIYAFLKAQKEDRPVELSCAIGDDFVDGIPYETIVEIARDYIKGVGGFEKFAEWGLI